jgi:hypothetical protein
LFVGVVLSVFALLRRLPFGTPPETWRAMPYAIGSVAAFWTIERVLSFVSV